MSTETLMEPAKAKPEVSIKARVYRAATDTWEEVDMDKPWYAKFLPTK